MADGTMNSKFFYPTWQFLLSFFFLSHATKSMNPSQYAEKLLM